jgi:hypothetical protein
MPRLEECPSCGKARIFDTDTCTQCGWSYKTRSAAGTLATDKPAKGPWWRRRWVLITAGVIVLLVLIGSLATPPKGAGALSITSPRDGSTVTEASVQVQGTAPPNAEVVEDISLASDKRTTAESDGTWVMTVDLKEGANDLVFRVRNDQASAKTIRVTYSPPTPTPTPTPSPTPTPTPTPSPTPTPTPTPTPIPTPTPSPTPVPTPAPETFGSGSQIVGQDVTPGTYRGDGGDSCYWERLSGFGGTFEEIIANDIGDLHPIVTIAATDAGFSSTNCGTWTDDLSAITSSPTAPFEDGTYQIGVDIAAGTWRAAGTESCYWERRSGFGGTFDEIIANGVGDPNPVVTIDASDAGFSSKNCAIWTRVGG